VEILTHWNCLLLPLTNPIIFNFSDCDSHMHPPSNDLNSQLPALAACETGNWTSF
ncbi:hypothetical protein Csa_007520, partial [Cucumis sativus]